MAFAHTTLITFPLWLGYGVRLVPFGATALVVFFVISGFVLGMSLDRNAHLPLSLRCCKFFWGRSWRIYPAHLAILLIIVPIGVLYLLHRHPVDLTGYPRIPSITVFYLHGQNFLFVTKRQLLSDGLLLTWRYNPVAWSLHVEVVLALLLPLLHWVARRRMTWMDVLLMAVCLAPGCIWDRQELRTTYPVTFVPAFYLGLLMPSWGPRWTRAMTRFGRPDLVFLLSSVVLVLPRKLWGAHWLSVVECIDSLTAFNVLVVLVWARPPVITRFLEHRTVRWVGRVSYSFYLWHWTVLRCTEKLFFSRISPAEYAAHSAVYFLGMFAVTVVLALVAADITHRFVEVPGIKLGARLWERRPRFANASQTYTLNSGLPRESANSLR